jgi:hypothetical protein
MGTGQVVHLLWRSEVYTAPAIGFLHMPKASPGENQLQVGIIKEAGKRKSTKIISKGIFIREVLLLLWLSIHIKPRLIE